MPKKKLRPMTVVPMTPMTQADAKAEILKLLATMNAEGFSWLALAMCRSAMTKGALTQVWPDGLGGFQDRVTIEAVVVAATKYCEAQS